MNVEQRIDNLVNQPGVYIWKDYSGNVLYVGKAKRLKHRMKQYFEGRLNSYKTNTLVENIEDFEVFLTKTEQEALILEKNLIEKYHPPFNILLIDDKRYPYLKIWVENKLKFKLERNLLKLKDDSVFYFGPFPSGLNASNLVKIMEREFLYENGLPIKNKNINYWSKKFSEAKTVLNLKNSKFVNELTSKMHEAAQIWNFELANDYKSAITTLKKMRDSQVVELETQKNIDVFAIKITDNKIYITVLFYRYGILLNKEFDVIEIITSINSDLQNYFEQFYDNHETCDSAIFNSKDEELINDLMLFFNIKFPKKGILKEIQDLCEAQNEINIKDNILKVDNSRETKHLQAFFELKKILELPKIQNLIVFDNSTLQNFEPVGAVVYFNGIQSVKSNYKKFNHSNYLTKNDRKADIQYMYLTVKRYFAQNSFNPESDLIVIDGAEEQLYEAKRALKELNIDKFNIISLVKNSKHETKAIINSDYIHINKFSNNLLNFLRYVQFEVDRFAKTHFRKRHLTSTLEGRISKIKGVGPAIEKRLLEHFGTYSNIYNASLEELCKIVPQKLAISIQKIKDEN